MADEQLLTLTSDIVAAHLANNQVATGDVAGLIRATYEALAGVGGSSPQPEQEREREEYVPATTVRKSLANRDRIISMIDGKPYTSLKRHLSAHGLTPAEYRERYGLKSDYPMVAPGYSEKRSAMSRELGLGRKKTAPAPEPAEHEQPSKPKAKRSRPKKLSGAEALDKVRKPEQQQSKLPEDMEISERDAGPSFRDPADDQASIG